MSKVFLILMGIAMVAVVGVLLTGLFSMARGGSFNAKYGNKLMQWRIWLQGIAIICFLIAVAARNAQQ